MDNIPRDDSRATPPKPGGRDSEDSAPSLGSQDSGGVPSRHEAGSMPSETQVEATGVNKNKQVRSLRGR